MDIERLIGSVHEHPALWDQKNKYYHNRDITRDSWSEVAQQCGIDSKYNFNTSSNFKYNLFSQTYTHGQIRKTYGPT